MRGIRKMINYRIRIKQIRKALFISRSVRPEYTVYDIKLSSLHKAMTDYYAPCEKDVWPEVDRWYEMTKDNRHCHHKAEQIRRVLSAYDKEFQFAEARYDGKEHYMYQYKERRKLASYYRHWDDDEE